MQCSAALSISEPENLEEASHDKSGFVWQVVGAIIGTLHLHPFWFPLGHLEKVMHLSNWWVTSQQAFCKRRGRNAHIPRWKFYIIVLPSKAQHVRLDRKFDTLLGFQDWNNEVCLFYLEFMLKLMHLSYWWVTSQQAFCKRRGRNAHIPWWEFYIIVSPSIPSISS